MEKLFFGLAIFIILIVVLIIYFGYLFSFPIGDSSKYINVDKCDQVTKNVIEAYKIEQVHTCKSEKFVVNGKEIFVVDISMGPPDDCPAGCIYHSFKTIVDGDADFPYCLSAFRQNILNLSVEEMFHQNSSKLTGRSQWFVNTPEFNHSSLNVPLGQRC